MKVALAALSISFALAAAVIAEDIDYTRPFPLSLLDFNNAGGYFDPVPFDVDNIQINSDNTSFLQNEEMVAINPQSTDNAVAIWRDFRLGYRRVGVGYTFDAGATWHDTLLVVPPYPWQSDPVLAVDSSGNYFACTLGLTSTGQGPTGIFVQKSTDGGITWSLPVTAIDNATQYFEDKQMIVLDRTSGPTYGNIYIAWTRFTADFMSSNIYMVSSLDAGQSYGLPVLVSEGSDVQWPVPVVDENGAVFVAWFRYHPRGIYIDYSTDEGGTFHADLLVTSVSATAGNINGEILVFPYPALASDLNPASRNYGNLYMAYMDDAGTDMDIFFMSSPDGFAWGPPSRINDDPIHNGADQFHPWITVDDQGNIHALFYDRRLDAANYLFDLYYTRSSDGGVTWSPNERITSVSSDPGQAALAGLIGEYIGLSAWRGQVQMAWTDTRNGNQDVFSGRMSLTSAREDEPSAPDGLAITSVYPNPFNSGVSIRYNLPLTGKANVEIYDLAGRRVRTLSAGQATAGSGQLIWDGADSFGQPMASGIYFVRLNSADKSAAQKAVLLR